jgi:endo-1,4-beta-xylanase
MNWASLDFAWNYAKSQGAVFTGHTLITAQQIPSWVSGLSPTDQAAQVEEWIKLYCKKYPDYQLLNVVNEPLHGAPNYADAIGGAGSTGWDWVIWSYQKARLYCPNARLVISDYDILTDNANTQTFIQIVNLLKARNLIDGIAEQGHRLESASIPQISSNLNALAAIERPIYISELDLDFLDEAQQLAKMKQIFPLFYENIWVKGVTFWGYVRG